MSDDNTQDGAEQSGASAGSQLVASLRGAGAWEVVHAEPGLVITRKRRQEFPERERSDQNGGEVIGNVPSGKDA
jgi:hypothetical protein